MSSQDSQGIWANRKCLFACLLMTLYPFQYGIDFGLIGGLQAMKGFLMVFGHEAPQTPEGWNISPVRQQLISSLMILGAFVSSAAVGPIAAVMGRKGALWVASFLCCIANAIMMASTDINALYVGRTILGIANGMYMTFPQLYLQECVTPKYRAAAMSFVTMWTGFGALVGSIVDNFTAKLEGRESYLIPLGLVFIMPVLNSIGQIFIPESPRWLAQHGKTEEARKALHWLRPTPELAEQEFSEMEKALEAEMEMSHGVALKDMFSNKIDRRRTLLSIGAITIQAASGSMFVISYGTYFFLMAGVGKPFENSCILQAVGLAAILANSLAAPKIGRRRVCLVTALVACGVCMIIIASVYDANPTAPSTGKLIIGLTMIYMVSYSSLIAPYAWVAGGELPSQRLRSYTFGLAAAVGFFFAWLTTFTAPYFINPEALNWGPKYGYIWLPSAWIAALWVYLYLPEAKDRTLEEIDEMFEVGLPARKFRLYQCRHQATDVPEHVSGEKDSPVEVSVTGK